MKIYTVIYTVLSLVAALILAGFVTAIGFIPPLVPYEFTIKFTVTITAGVVSVIILVGGIGGVLGGEGNTLWVSVGSGATSLILTAASVVGGWYIFWVNPIARAEYEDVVLGDSSFAKELVSGLLDEAYDEDCSEAGYFDYRIGLWYGASYSSYGYRRGAPINLYVSHCPGLVWTVSASGYFPVPVASVKYVNINPYQMRVGPDGDLEVEDDAGEWVPLSKVSGYLANDPKASDSLRRLLKEDVDFSIDYGAPRVTYYIHGGSRLDVLAERERLSRLLDLIAGIYPEGYDYNWDPAEFGDYNV
ncbi:MAG: hypothetical protein JSW52_05190 [Candidatus Coatesbacteria bacterium]|nr:MAG: hypothetical protein JSW52_05190 [Candidatus Coatesbacteria bacterium]